MKKRLLATVLAVCMALGMLPCEAWAAPPEEAGEDEPVPEETVEPEGSEEAGEPEKSEETEKPEPPEPEVPEEPGSDEEFEPTNPMAPDVPNSGAPEDTVPPDAPGEGEIALYGHSSSDITYSVTGGNLYFDKSTGTIIDCDTGVTEAVIPSTIDGVSVASIGYRAFYLCSYLTSVTIPDSVSSIGEQAFQQCSRLTSITIPNSVTSIGDGAFSICDGLTSAGPIGGGYDYEFGWTDRIPSYAFFGCGLTSIAIPNSVTSIGKEAFRSCRGLTSIIIPNSVTSIEESAFIYCEGLTSITIPNSVTSIGYRAFQGCSGLTSAGPIGGGYNYEFSWTDSIPDHAFSGCSGLASVTIPNSVISIGGYAFSGCSGLTNVTIPNSVTSIGTNAFQGCSGLTSAGPRGGGHSYEFSWTDSIPDHAFSGCNGLTGVTIPNSVTSIGDRAFSGCRGLTSVTIPDSVISIGRYAFSGCSGLTSVTIPNSVTSVGDEAFYDCSGLTSAGPIGSKYNIEVGWTEKIPDEAFKSFNCLSSITIPNSVTSIGNRAFFGCRGLTSITIPDSVISIGGYAFSGCSGLTSVTIPNSVTSIGDEAFYNCRGLTSITISSSVTSISSELFCNCSGLTSITIPNSVTSIGNKAFQGCSGLTSLMIPNSVTSIGSHAFNGCSGLTSVTIPSSVTFIGEGAFTRCNGLASAGPIGGEYNIKLGWTEVIPGGVFRGCSSLTSVTIPQGVRSIGSDAFDNCSGLTSLTIPDSVTSIYAFDNCSGLTSAGPIGGEYNIKLGWTEVIPDEAFSSFSSLTSVTIPNSVTSIGSYAFHGCKRLTSVTIPSSVTSIGNDAFLSCTGLTSVVIPNSVTSIGDCAFSGCSGLASVTIPNGITFTGSFAFNFCTAITHVKVTGKGAMTQSVSQCWKNSKKSFTVDIGNGITSITDRMFYFCAGLTSVTIPDSVTSIEKEAFYNCSDLTSVTIPNSVTSIGENAFGGCRNLTNVTIPNSVTSIGENAFGGCRNLTNVTIPNSVTSIGYMAFSHCSSLTSAGPIGGRYDYEFGWTEKIPDNAFSTSYGSSGLTSVTIPSSITSIGNNAFSCCDGLTSIIIPSSVTSIGDNAFHNCTGLTSITIPSSVTSIGEFAFFGCSSLTSVTIPGSVTSFGLGAFEDCGGLTSATILNGVTSIDQQAFMGCSGLTNIAIPNSVTSIEDYAFYECTSLTDVYYSGSQADWAKISIDSNNDPLKSATIHFNSTGPEIPDDIRFDQGYSYTTTVGETIDDLIVSVPNPNGLSLDDITFTSSDEEVVARPSVKFQFDLAEMGLLSFTLSISGLKAGTATITASATDGRSASCTVTVRPKAGPNDLVIVSSEPSRGYAYPQNSLSLTFSWSVALDLLGPEQQARAIRIMDYDTDEEVLRFDASNLNSYGMAVDNQSFSIKNAFETLSPGKYYILIDEGMFKTVGTVDGEIRYFAGIHDKKTLWFNYKIFTAQSPIHKSGRFNYYGSFDSDTIGTYTYEYDEAWFNNASTEYQHDLTRMSIRMAMAGFGNDTGDKDASKNIQTLMEDLGFENIVPTYPTPQRHSIGYIIGAKNIRTGDGKEYSLINVTIRGGGYGLEWGGNFQVGSNTEHEGWTTAKEKVIRGIEAYMEEYGSQLFPNQKVWIQGYSRASAVMNLVAKEMDLGNVRGITAPMQNIYAFGFEVPQSTRALDRGDNNKYGNIVNIANPIDLVTKVIPTGFSPTGYGRYGKTYYLPYHGGTKDYTNLHDKMREELKKIAALSGKSDEVNGRFNAPEGMAASLDALSANLSAALSFSSVNYERLVQKEMIFLVEALLVKEIDMREEELIEAGWQGVISIPYLASWYLNPGNMAVAGFAGSNIAQTGKTFHFSELCLAWLDSLDGEMPYQNSSLIYRRVCINCPVDVRVYDSKDVLVGEIVNGKVVDQEESSIFAYIDGNDQMVLILPVDEEYRIEMTATAAGTVTYTTTEYNMEDADTERLVGYYEIEVAKDDVLTGIAENLDNDTAEYPLALNDENLDATLDQSGDEVSEYTVTVTAHGNGTAYGGGIYVSGEFAKVIATPDDGDDFLGWYIDEKLVSTELEYRFLVDQDIFPIAVFTKQELTASYAKGNSIHYTVCSTSSKPKDVYVVAALYESSGKLLEMKMEPLTLKKGESSGTLDFKATSVSSDRVKVFLLGQSDYTPLCDPISFLPSSG